MKKLIYLSIALLLISCGDSKQDDGKFKIVTTTTMITDMVSHIGGDAVTVNGLMGAGVDPHLYKASEGDVSKLFQADLIIYNGLHLEGKLVEVFEKMEKQGRKTIAISNGVDQKTLINSANFASNYDPHIWFDINYWSEMTTYVTDQLVALKPEHKDLFEKNRDAYLEEIAALKIELETKIATLPQEKRILVTAHDAFNYYGRTFGFEVVGLQGISTATEAGVQDVQKITNFIVEKNIKAVFVESSVPRRTVEALKAAVKAKGKDIIIGGELYSDALGSKGTAEGTYVGMYKHNVNTIVNALQ